MAVVTGLTPTSQEVWGSPAVSQGWSWLRQPCNQPSPPCYSFLSHHPLCPSVCFPFARGNCQPQIPSAVVWGQVTRGQTAPEDDWSTTTIGTSSPWDCLWLQSRRGQIGGGTRRQEERVKGWKTEVKMWRSVGLKKQRDRSWWGSLLHCLRQNRERRGEFPCLLFSWSYKQYSNPCDLLSISLSIQTSLLNGKKKTFKLHRPPFSFPQNLIFNFWTFFCSCCIPFFF